MAKKAKTSNVRKPARGKKGKAPAEGKKEGKAEVLSALLRNILVSKGVPEGKIDGMARKGIRSREDFKEVGDARTLAELADLPLPVAEKVMSWAAGAATVAAKGIVVESGDAVYCVHCKTKQPVDFKSGDLCVSCGKQAEPILACFWCSSSGPGKYCRQCAAEFVPPGELQIAILLKREGLPKDEIPVRLKKMSTAEKDELWGRIRRG